MISIILYVKNQRYFLIWSLGIGMAIMVITTIFSLACNNHLTYAYTSVCTANSRYVYLLVSDTLGGFDFLTSLCVGYTQCISNTKKLSVSLTTVCGIQQCISNTNQYYRYTQCIPNTCSYCHLFNHTHRKILSNRKY